MRFVTLSEAEIKNTAIYKSIKQNHIVISITGSDRQETIIPPSTFRLDELHLKFDDIEDLMDKYIYFDRGAANEILDFLETHCNSVDLVIVQCQAGLSRSVGVAAALSKIINYCDDNIYTKGIPNMLVYTTILDVYFGNRYYRNNYPKIQNKRLSAMRQFLQPGVIKLQSVKETKRMNNE